MLEHQAAKGAASSEDYDVVCIGAGAGGLASAIAAADLGLRVIVIEQTPRIGGNTAWSYGIVWAGNNHLAQAEGIEDSPASTQDYLEYLGGGRNDPEVTRSFIDHSPTAIQYFETKVGIPFYMVKKLPDHYFPLGKGSVPQGRSLQVRPFEASSIGSWGERLERNPYGHGRVTFEEMAAWGGRAGYRQWDRDVVADRERRDVRTFGGALVGHLLKAAIDRNIPIRLQMEAVRLIEHEARICGVEVKSSNGTGRIKASRGVILATGIYDANPRLMNWFDEFNPWPPGAPRNHGGGLIMALERGSAFCVSHWNLSIKLSYHVEGETVDGQPFLRVAGPREMAYPHSLIVNEAGRRFADESSFGDVATKLREFDFRNHRLVNVPCYLIFDSQYLEKYGLPPLPPGAPSPNWLPSADSVGELGKRLGLDVNALIQTVERFNGFVTKNADEDFRRGEMPWARQAASDLKQKNPNLGLVSRPPFFGLTVHPSQGQAVGLVTDGIGRVTHLRGEPIPGLYACGAVASWRHAGVGYQAGLSLAGAMTFGWLAALHAAGKSPPH